MTTPMELPSFVEEEEETRLQEEEVSFCVDDPNSWSNLLQRSKHPALRILEEDVDDPPPTHQQQLGTPTSQSSRRRVLPNKKSRLSAGAKFEELATRKLELLKQKKNCPIK